MRFKSHIKELVRPMANLVWSSSIYRQILFRGDELVWMISQFLRTNLRSEKYTILLSPAGEGNIGDHAMLDAYLEMTEGPLVILSSGEGAEMSTQNPLLFRQGRAIRVIPARHIYTLPPLLRAIEVLRFSRLLRNADAFHIHGADTMDGSQAACSLARLSLCNLAVKQGVRTEILGFSWQEDPPAVVSDAMVALSRKMHIKPRDPLSARRLESAGACNIKPVSDMAFSLTREMAPPQDVVSWIMDCRSRGNEFVVLNVSGLIARKMDQTVEISHVVAEAHSNGLSVLFLPHVIRHGDDDLLAVLEAYSSYGTESNLCVTELLTPAEVRFITSRAKVTITGRMHLSILSLSAGTPAIALDTAGKVEGLFELFGMRQFVVRAEPGFGREIGLHLSEALLKNSQMRNQIATVMETVRVSSRANFSDLATARDFGLAEEGECAS